MKPLVLSDDQIRLLLDAGGRATLVDAQGRMVGIVSPPLFSSEEIAEVKRKLASAGRIYSVAEKNRWLEHFIAEIEATEEASDSL